MYLNYICHAPFNTHLSPSFTSETQSNYHYKTYMRSYALYLEASPPVGVWHTLPDTVECPDARPPPLHESGVPKGGVVVLSFFILFPMTVLTDTWR